eukprot:gnl/TRDRNA2_/TRDRNA2_46262_c0_seq1.p1 gnl/TRDRNA2_/TRDRNA2_46262_c0~~gnl/TRDRNA2_/TRDRNA2_46262_c0_seq1.p1  ORF type:complete len:242 (+),score=12.70 gnl/TRDRNA2_/TRDRNA2_46262_c0_seq1:31-756(+)
MPIASWEERPHNRKIIAWLGIPAVLARTVTAVLMPSTDLKTLIEVVQQVLLAKISGRYPAVLLSTAIMWDPEVLQSFWAGASAKHTAIKAASTSTADLWHRALPRTSSRTGGESARTVEVQGSLHEMTSFRAVQILADMQGAWQLQSTPDQQQSLCWLHTMDIHGTQVTSGEDCHTLHGTKVHTRIISRLSYKEGKFHIRNCAAWLEGKDILCIHAGGSVSTWRFERSRPWASGFEEGSQQ